MMTREEGPLQIYQTESTLFIEKPFNANSPGCYHGRGQTWGFSLILAAPTHPLHDTVALDSGSEARYVRRQGRGLGI